jgi:hypothetical protein
MGSPVHIVAIDTPARVTGVMVDESGIQYRVVYWAESKRESIWVFYWELTDRKRLKETLL